MAVDEETALLSSSSRMARSTIFTTVVMMRYGLPLSSLLALGLGLKLSHGVAAFYIYLYFVVALRNVGLVITSIVEIVIIVFGCALMTCFYPRTKARNSETQRSQGSEATEGIQGTEDKTLLYRISMHFSISFIVIGVPLSVLFSLQIVIRYCFYILAINEGENYDDADDILQTTNPDYKMIVWATTHSRLMGFVMTLSTLTFGLWLSAYQFGLLWFQPEYFFAFRFDDDSSRKLHRDCVLTFVLFVIPLTMTLTSLIVMGLIPDTDP